MTQGYRKKAESAAGQLRFRDMIQKGLVSETLLDNIIRAAAIFKEEGDEISILQINEQFAAMLGLSAHDGETGRFLEHLDGDSPLDVARACWSRPTPTRWAAAPASYATGSRTAASYRWICAYSCSTRWTTTACTWVV